MIELSPAESRVLGVLIEKALTTPDQYPLTLNAVVNGANQKNNRDPVLAMTDTEAFDALEGLRGKGLATRVDSVGSRTNRYKQTAQDALRVRTGELVVLAELLLRGPQTLGELRGRASRMHPLESLDVVKEMLRALSDRPEPLVRELPPTPGSRAERYAQLLCPDLHPLDAPAAAAATPAANVPPTGASGGAGLAARVEALEGEVDALRGALRRLAQAVGEPDPLAAPEPSGTAAPGKV